MNRKANHPRRVTVVGACHLDIRCQVAPTAGADSARGGLPPEGRLDGRLVIDFGGTARTVALHLISCVHHQEANAGSLNKTEVVLGSVMTDSMLSRAQAASLQQEGVRPLIEFRPDLSEAGSCTIAGYDPIEPDLGMTVNALPISQIERFDDEHLARMLECDLVVADCDLSPPSLLQLARGCARRRVPLLIAGVAEDRLTHLTMLVEAGEPVAGLFLNRAELSWLLAFEDYAAGSLDVLTTRIGGLVVETRGADGVAVWSQRGLVAEYVPEDHCRAAERWPGAGSRLIAETAYRLLAAPGIPLDQAALDASRAVSAMPPQDLQPRGGGLEERLRVLEHSAFRDSLTGLLNRHGFEEYRAGLSYTAKAALLLLDIDHFKQVNDTCGHDGGDLVLRKIAGAISRSLRQGDAACRWGGEEMIVILHGVDADGALHAAERLREAVLALDDLPEPLLSVSCTIGVATGEMGDIDSLREAADEALYRGKRDGRNRVVMAATAS